MIVAKDVFAGASAICVVVSRRRDGSLKFTPAFVAPALRILQPAWIGIDPGVIIAFATACYGYFILPTYPSDLAAVQFDRSGTTHIGKYVINHSFIIPGFIGVFSSCAVGWVLANLYGFIK